MNEHLFWNKVDCFKYIQSITYKALTIHSELIWNIMYVLYLLEHNYAKHMCVLIIIIIAGVWLTQW